MIPGKLGLRFAAPPRPTLLSSSSSMGWVVQNVKKVKYTNSQTAYLQPKLSYHMVSSKDFEVQHHSSTPITLPMTYLNLTLLTKYITKQLKINQSKLRN